MSFFKLLSLLIEHISIGLFYWLSQRLLSMYDFEVLSFSYEGEEAPLRFYFDKN